MPNFFVILTFKDSFIKDYHPFRSLNEVFSFLLDLDKSLLYSCEVLEVEPKRSDLFVNYDYIDDEV